ncbi:M16 family metallopeptidase [Salinibius halmophilus]|uniref:M16 family metallopeptidase n=1 Tax=Salinibius halmophilus TaxID=1853216 RepID=UPI000E66E127|nr:insulinase family protein [Salinibius halmophilus]
MRMFAACLLLPFCANAFTIEDIADDRVEIGQLENGLHYYILPLEKTDARPTVEMRLHVQAGSLDEQDDQLGYAHFVEHMAFNGSENYPGNDLVRFFEQAGMQFGGDINAYTTFNETVYQLSIPVEQPGLIDEAYTVLADWAWRLTFDQQEVEKEKGVILEEWRAVNANQSSVQQQVTNTLLANSTWQQRMPIGTPESIEQATAESLTNFWRTHYQPDRMSIVVAGPVDAEFALHRINQEFGDFADNSLLEAAQAADDLATQNRPWFKFTDNNIAIQTLEYLRVIHPEEQSVLDKIQNDFKQLVVQHAVNQYLADIATQPNSPVTAFELYAFDYFADSLIVGLAVNLREGREQEGGVLLERERQRLMREGVNQAAIDEAKVSLMASIADHRNTMQNAPSNYYIETLLEAARGELSWAPSVAATAEVLASVSVTTQDSIDIINTYFSNDTGGYALTHPTGVGQNITSDTVARWVTQARQQPTAAKESIANQIVWPKQYPGTAELTRTLDINNGYEFSLSNGQTAWLVQSDIETDRVQLQLYLDQGYLLLDDADIPAATVFADLVAYQPHLGLQPIQLSQELARRQIAWEGSIDAYDGYIWAELPVEELDTVAQLFVDALYQPFKNNDRVGDDLAAYQDYGINYGNTAEGIYDRQLREIMWGQNNHAWPDLSLVTMTSLMQAATLFQNPNNRWMIVGDVELDEVQRVLEHYIAGLPTINFASTNAMQSPLPLGKADYMDGSREDGAYTQLIRRSAKGYDPVVASIAIEVLDQALIEVVREQHSLVYYIGSDNYATTPFYNEVFSTIDWQTDVGNTEEVIELVNATISRLVDGGLTEKQVKQAKRRVTTNYAEFYATLGGLLGELEYAHSIGIDPMSLRKNRELANQVDYSAVRQFITDFYTGDAYQVTYQP